MATKMDFDVERTVELIKRSGAKKVAIQFPDGLVAHASSLAETFEKTCGVEVVVLADLVYGACCIDDELSRALGASLLVHYGHAQIVADNAAPSARVVYVHVTAPAGDGSAVAEAAVSGLPPHCKVALCSTAQFLPMAEAAVPALEARGFTAHLLPSSGGHLRAGEVLGCTAPTVPEGSADAIIYVGDGRFHVEAAAIANPTIPTYRYDPYTGAFSREAHDCQGVAAARRRSIEKAKNAKLVGIAVSTLGRQANMKALQRIKRLLDARGTPHFTALLSDISPSALDSFGAVDAWVQVACPRLSLDWGSAFSAPLLTTLEAIVAFSPSGKAQAADESLCSSGERVPDMSNHIPLDNWATESNYY